MTCTQCDQRSTCFREAVLEKVPHGPQGCGLINKQRCSTKSHIHVYCNRRIIDWIERNPPRRKTGM